MSDFWGAGGDVGFAADPAAGAEEWGSGEGFAPGEEFGAGFEPEPVAGPGFEEVPQFEPGGPVDQFVEALTAERLQAAFAELGLGGVPQVDPEHAARVQQQQFVGETMARWHAQFPPLQDPEVDHQVRVHAESIAAEIGVTPTPKFIESVIRQYWVPKWNQEAQQARTAGYVNEIRAVSGLSSDPQRTAAARTWGIAR